MMGRLLRRWGAGAVGFVVVTLIATATASGQDCAGATARGIGFSSPRATAPAAGHDLAIIITAPAACHWTVTTDAPFLVVLSPPAGSGNAEIALRSLPNPADGRFAFATVRFPGELFDPRFVVAQRGCLSPFSPPPYPQVFPGYFLRHPVDATGGLRYLRVNPETDVCAWPARSNVPWIDATAGGYGVAPGVVHYMVEPNPLGEPREGTITVGYLTFTIRQAAGAADDLNGDGHADLLWHHRTSGNVAAWLMRGTQLLDGRLLEPPQVDTAWTPVGSGDFDEDGRPDIVWQHDDGRVALWAMDGLSLVRGTVLGQVFPVDSAWRVAAVADLNSDGYPDIILRHTGSGAIRVWLMLQSTKQGDGVLSPAGVPDVNWRIVGAADFTQDGQADLLWQNVATGEVAIWALAWGGGLSWSVTDGRLINPPQVADTAWRISGVADINRDGHPDLLWHHDTTGLISTWLMHGTDLIDGRLFSPGQVPDTGWRVVGPR